ncbi:MAG: hypothetical protein ABWU13_10590, partial [Limnospira maxima]
GRAYRNFRCAEQRFGRQVLYCCWRNPASASRVVEQRIPVRSRRGVSRIVYGTLIQDLPIILTNVATFVLASTILWFKLKYH